MVHFEPHMLHILVVGQGGGNCLHMEVLSREALGTQRDCKALL